MSKTWYPARGASFPTITCSATTVGPQVAETVTTSPAFAELVHCGVFTEGGRTLSIFRKSSMDPGTLSCEVYDVKNNIPTYRHKKAVKYAPPDTLIPGNVKHMTIDGVRCSSYDEFTRERIEVLRTLLRRRTIGP